MRDTFRNGSKLRKPFRFAFEWNDEIGRGITYSTTPSFRRSTCFEDAPNGRILRRHTSLHFQNVRKMTSFSNHSFPDGGTNGAGTRNSKERICSAGIVWIQPDQVQWKHHHPTLTQKTHFQLIAFKSHQQCGIN